MFQTIKVGSCLLTASPELFRSTRKCTPAYKKDIWIMYDGAPSHLTVTVSAHLHEQNFRNTKCHFKIFSL